MIICPICKTENHHLQIICINCGGYIQKKIENLDLFSVIWKLIDSPQKAFKIIALSKHKNYTIFLSILFGISCLYLFYELVNLGDKLENGLLLLSSGIILGIPFGLLLLSIQSLLIILSSYFITTPVKFKNVYAVISYSTVPIILILIIIFPIKLLSFGVIHFGTNPSPSLVNPMVHYITYGLEMILFIWFVFLNFIGLKTLYEISSAKALSISIIPLLIICFSFYFVIIYLKNL